MPKRDTPNSKPRSAGFFTKDYFKQLAQKLRDKWIEDGITFIAKTALWAGVAGVVGYLGYTVVTPDYPPAYNENAAQNPDGPYHFMPMVQYARDNLGYEVQFDPIIELNSLAITYPEAISVHKIRGDVLREFHKKYPHCLIFERKTINSVTDNQDPKILVTIRFNQLVGPINRDDDPRTFYQCEKIDR